VKAEHNTADERVVVKPTADLSANCFVKRWACTVQSFNYIQRSPGCKPASTFRELTANYVIRTFTPSPLSSSFEQTKAIIIIPDAPSGMLCF
jgi:hypothetical protein